MRKKWTVGREALRPSSSGEGGAEEAGGGGASRVADNGALHQVQKTGITVELGSGVPGP